jgi:hypothetical protein
VSVAVGLGAGDGVGPPQPVVKMFSVHPRAMLPVSGNSRSNT